MHQKGVAGFEDSIPYVTALVELVEQPLLFVLTNLPGLNPSQLCIGDAVHAVFDSVVGDYVLPQFALVAEAGS
jgi:uncharacterized OB-fold protein